jgi:PAS domain-containing protein
MSLGLVALTLCTVLVGDLVLGLTSDDRRALLDQRKKICETLAVQFSELAGAGEIDTIRKSMDALVAGNADVMSIALVDADGDTFASAGEHAKFWESPGGNNSTPTHAQVPIFSGDDKWGTVEVSFAKTGLDVSLLLEDPLVQFLVFLAVAGFMGYMIFMKKSLKHLDPKAVIPDRVRSALDLLAEGVVMVDQKNDVVLANLAFASKVGKDVDALLGQSLSKMAWHYNDAKGKRVRERNLPWAKAMKRSGTQTRQQLTHHGRRQEHARRYGHVQRRDSVAAGEFRAGGHDGQAEDQPGACKDAECGAAAARHPGSTHELSESPVLFRASGPRLGQVGRREPATLLHHDRH